MPRSGTSLVEQILSAHSKTFGAGETTLLENKLKRTSERLKKRTERAGGGLMEATARLKRQGLGMGGSVCKIAKRGQNRDAIGKNS